MCNFWSCIVTRDPIKVLFIEGDDSHDNIIKHHELPTNNDLRNYARVEIVPPRSRAIFVPAPQWKLVLDERRRPEWFSPEHERAARMVHEDYIANHIIVGKKLERLPEGFNFFFIKDTRVGALTGKQIIREMYGSSQVHEMWDSSQVHKMWDSSQVREMYGSSQVREMWDSSQVHEMRDSSQVREMYGSSQVHEMRGSSQVHKMWDSSQVHEMYGSSQIGHARTDAPHPHMTNDAVYIRRSPAFKIISRLSL